ncbi:MAG: hypothetical protein QM482_10380 [Sulfurospirillum sp.]
MKEIALDMTIAELLNNYKGMKDILIEINPKFKKLNKDEVLEIISSFRPEPLIADFISKSYRVNTQEISNDRFSTKIIV